MKSVLELRNKRGQLGNLQGIIMTLVVVGILVGVGYLVLSKFMEQMDAGSDAEAGVNATIQAFDTIPEFLPIIIIVAVVGILLAIVFSVLPRQGMSA
jgi:phosphotransferase system  glucose/maltose/N-acetylglucosamine-specific IIC component